MSRGALYSNMGTMQIQSFSRRPNDGSVSYLVLV